MTDGPYGDETDVAGARAAALREARRWLGTPYRHQAGARQAGCDCLGLIRGVWRALYGVEPSSIPAYTLDWSEAGGVERLRDGARLVMRELPLDARAPGDILLFRVRRSAPAKHLAVLSQSDRMIHALLGRSVQETPLTRPWRARLAHVFQFPPLPPHNDGL